MTSKITLPLVGLHALVFILIFHSQSLAINLFLYELAWIAYFLWRRELTLQSTFSRVILCTLVVSASTLIWVSSYWCIAVNLLVMLVFLGNVMQHDVRSVISALGHAFYAIPLSQLKISQLKIQSNTPIFQLFRRLKQWYIFIIPIIIIVVFVLLYSGANKQFGELVVHFFDSIGQFFQKLFQHFEFTVLFTLLVGLIIGNIFLFRIANKKIEDHDREASEILTRKRERLFKVRYFPFNGLRREFRAAVFLLVVLNGLLAILNILDIQNVWLKSAAEQSDYAQSVHEGIYLLITSILISIALVLYYFRKNLNFLQRNQTLKALAYIWILQNALLVVSAGVRNYRYIENCALAYKRIGVWIFLVAVLVGLITVLIKVQRKKTSFYLFRTNSIAVLIILVVSSLINWDIVIARYNLSRTELPHLDNRFLISLSDKALPYLTLSPEMKERMKNYTPEYSRWNEGMLDVDSYNMQLSERKQQFIQKWENYSPLEWNLPEYLAYKDLKAKEDILPFSSVEN